ncbi:hypothetical protein L2E82_34275 [Cichorium intybus]|uniref:Uncharacterized protein n=1 Tax=Cichorium intybus TaxID=13427 RepID=A0ACB9BM03_CICIN|nr:hypothetical protein L2E82_34275 [Cichorium intybus]
MTEKVYEELDNAKAEIEKLRSEYHLKSNLCDSLKRSHEDQIKRIQELKLKLEKQSQELEAKTDEIYASNQSLKDLECKLKEKENIIKSFTSANDKLRIDFNSKLQETEEEKRNLLFSLDEANVKIQELEQKNRDFMDKIEVLKEGIVSVSQKKCASESKVAKASKQMREKGDMFEKLEDEKVKLEEQIKWKNEQFKHLEEAHEKLRDNLRVKKKEWDMEKSSFLDEISILETKLDSQITLSEDLQRRLESCKQALVHEQNQRKSRIQEDSNSSSLVKLQKKLKTLEHVHGQTQVKEAEWRSKFEKVVEDLNSCKKEMEKKDTRLKEITKELHDHNSLLLQSTMEKQESEVMILVLKSTLLEAKSKINEELEKKDTRLKEITKELVDYNSLLLQSTMEKQESEVMILALKSTLLEARSKINEVQESKNLDIVKVQESKNLDIVKVQESKNLDIVKVQESKNLDLVKVQESKNLDIVKVQESKNLDLVKVQESVKQQHEEEMQLLHKEMKKVCDLLDMANEEIDERCCEVNEVEFELQIWKSVVENLKQELEVNHRIRKEVECSLLSQVAIEVNLKEENEEKDKRINELQQKLEESKKNTDTLLRFSKDTLLRFSKENGEKVEKEKDEKINRLEKIMKSLEDEFDNSSVSFSSQLSKMQMEMNMFHEAWEKIRTNVVIKEIEVQERDLMIKEMEKFLEKISLENEKLVEIIGGVSERISKLSREDGQMMGTLRSIMMSFDEKDRFDPVKENTNVLFQSPKRRNMESGRDDHRSPLRALNG